LSSYTASTLFGPNGIALEGRCPPRLGCFSDLAAEAQSRSKWPSFSARNFFRWSDRLFTGSTTLVDHSELCMDTGRGFVNIMAMEQNQMEEDIPPSIDTPCDGWPPIDARAANEMIVAIGSAHPPATSLMGFPSSIEDIDGFGESIGIHQGRSRHQRHMFSPTLTIVTGTGKQTDGVSCVSQSGRDHSFSQSTRSASRGKRCGSPGRSGDGGARKVVVTPSGKRSSLQPKE
jgi:hypothetical protein